MNKTLLLIMFLAFSLALAAQTTLDDLTFGLSNEAVSAMLEDQGFVLQEHSFDRIVAIPAEKRGILDIEMDFTEYGDSLKTWIITYQPQDDYDIELVIMDQLEERHGDDWIWNDYIECYYWDLGENHWLFAGWGWDYEAFWVEYSTD